PKTIIRERNRIKAFFITELLSDRHLLHWEYSIINWHNSQSLFSKRLRPSTSLRARWLCDRIVKKLQI
ncbi:MAG: hypothetical protein IKF90_04635, partial [Parasporobacterium sp.]|nr:hypothetical protein [Parasporobacterium sp.]